MKTSGSLLLIIGAVWALIAFNSDTTVYVDGPFGKKVHNAGLMDERRNHLLLASLVVVVGTILFAFGNTRRTKTGAALASVVPGSDSQDCTNSRYNSERNITSGKYQLFLTKKYRIEKNATLEKYVIGDNLFETLEEALAFCDNKEGQAERERLKDAYKIEYVRRNSNAEQAGIEVGDILLAYNRRAIASDRDIADAINSATEPTTTLVVFRDNKPLILTVNAGQLGIDGRIDELDPPTYALRVRKTA